jgi:hypothetical protein
LQYSFWQSPLLHPLDCPYHWSCLVCMSSNRDLVTFIFFLNNIIYNFVFLRNTSWASPEIHFCGIRIEFCFGSCFLVLLYQDISRVDGD